MHTLHHRITDRTPHARFARSLALAAAIGALGAADDGIASVRIVSLRVDDASMSTASPTKLARIVITDGAGQPGHLAHDVEVSLAHDAPSWIALPASVLVSAGASSAEFAIDLLAEDIPVDGIPVVITGAFADENGVGRASAALSLINDVRSDG